MSIGDFNKLFEKEFPLISPSLPFVEKFKMMSLIKPDIEVWTAMCILNKDGTLYRSWRDSISTSGRVWGHSFNKERKARHDKDGYLFGFWSGMFSTIHRSLMCSFCMDIETDVSKSELTVNHKDKVRDHNYILNLEWMPFVDNVRDSSKTMSKPFRVEVIKEKMGIPVGTTFDVSSRSWLSQHGIDVIKFKESIRKTTFPFGLKITTLSKEDYNETPIPSEFVDYLKLKLKR